ncbi:hypothetical protein NL676_036839 [Syzygium grande]|nr:hypothetical protein NL676_036839 [Syzygium grande]
MDCYEELNHRGQRLWQSQWRAVCVDLKEAPNMEVGWSRTKEIDTSKQTSWRSWRKLMAIARFVSDGEGLAWGTGEEGGEGAGIIITEMKKKEFFEM